MAASGKATRCQAQCFRQQVAEIFLAVHGMTDGLTADEVNPILAQGLEAGAQAMGRCLVLSRGIKGHNSDHDRGLLREG